MVVGEFQLVYNYYMFTIEQINESHALVKSGIDFPAHVQRMIVMGIESYTVNVKDGHAEYVGTDSYRIQSEPKYPTQLIANNADIEKFREYLKMHQEGHTDYITFCTHAAETGVDKWIANFKTMTCTYFDKQGNVMHTEEIPLK